MPTILGRNGAKLLKVVGGKQHASSDDHEEVTGPRPAVAQREWTEEEINADPIDSDDEPVTQAPPPPLQSLQPSISKLAKNVKPTKTQSKGTRKSARKIHIPRQGSYREGQKAKAGWGEEEEKENVAEPPTSSGEKRSADGMFGMEYSGSKRWQPASSSAHTVNIHAPPARTQPQPKKRTFGRNKGTRTAM
jgi:hypothetical protein